ncbi:MAG: DUF4924 family protein [Flavobacteriales bacterium]|nr:DUF4924 family protein [Flavobacteriales bacterium]
MRVAEEKLKSNVAEYILYMWQMEDVVRSFNFDIEAIEFNLLRPVLKSEEELKAEKEWFSQLIRNMKNQEIEQKGHLNDIYEIIQELFYLHNTLLNVAKDPSYLQLHEEAAPGMEDYRLRSKSHSMNEVELCFNALYTKLLLRLKKQEISSETESAFTAFSKMISYLCSSYHKMKKGELNFNFNLN